MIGLAVLTQFRSVAKRQTDRHFNRINAGKSFVKNKQIHWREEHWFLSVEKLYNDSEIKANANQTG